MFISMYVYYDYYVNFDRCRKVPYSRNQLHAVSLSILSHCISRRSGSPYLFGIVSVWTTRLKVQFHPQQPQQQCFYLYRRSSLGFRTVW